MLSMRFCFKRKKAAQAAAYLLGLRDGKMDQLVLLKLLYLADRKALVETGSPITGDQMVSMPHGPVLSQIYDSIKCGQDEDNPWYDYISERGNNTVFLVKEAPKDDELSEYETKVLDSINEEFGHLTALKIRALTHELPEYTDPQGSSLPIDPADILKIEGKSSQAIEQATRSAEEMYFLTNLLQKKHPTVWP